MKKILHFILFLSSIGSMTAQTPSNLWTPQGMGVLPINHSIYSMRIVNKDVVWAVGDTLLTATSTNPFSRMHVPKILKTTNGGTTWQLYTMPEAAGRAAIDIYAVDSSVAWVTTRTFSTGLTYQLFKTTDGGNTWIAKTSGYETSQFVHFFDAQNGIAWNRQRITRTQNGGETWTGSDIGLFRNNENIATGSTNNAWAVIGDSIWAGTSISRMAFSTDRGLSWQLQNLQSVPNFGTNTVIISTAFKDARNGITLAYNGTTFVAYLAKTTDGGTTWSAISTYPFTLGVNVEYIRGTKNSYMVVDYEGLSAYTTNAGQSWIKIDSLRANSVGFLNAQTGWVSTWNSRADSPAFYKWNGGSSLTDIKVIEPEEVSLNISPNPTSRYLTVSYSADFKPTELTLYDLAGKTVFNKKDPSVFSQVIDLEGLANGIYLLQLKNREGIVAAQKVVVER